MLARLLSLGHQEELTCKVSMQSNLVRMRVLDSIAALSKDCLAHFLLLRIVFRLSVGTQVYEQEFRSLASSEVSCVQSAGQLHAHVL